MSEKELAAKIAELKEYQHLSGKAAEAAENLKDRPKATDKSRTKGNKRPSCLLYGKRAAHKEKVQQHTPAQPPVEGEPQECVILRNAISERLKEMDFERLKFIYIVCQ